MPGFRCLAGIYARVLQTLEQQQGRVTHVRTHTLCSIPNAITVLTQTHNATTVSTHQARQLFLQLDHDEVHSLAAASKPSNCMKEQHGHVKLPTCRALSHAALNHYKPRCSLTFMGWVSKVAATSSPPALESCSRTCAAPLHCSPSAGLKLEETPPDALRLLLAVAAPAASSRAPAKPPPAPTTWLVTSTLHCSASAVCRSSRAVSATNT